MNKIVTIERKLQSTGEWETMGAFSFAEDGAIGEIQGDPEWLMDLKFVDREAGGPVTHDSHPEAWLRQLSREYNGPTRRLTIEPNPEEV